MIYFLVFFAGFVDAVAGGGGLISLTGYLAVGVPAHQALGTNKFSSSCGTGLAAAYFVRRGHVEWRATLLSVVGAFLGSAIGAWLALLVPEEILPWILLAIIPLVGVLVLRKREFAVVKAPSPNRLPILAFAIGVVIGVYDGFIGPGTGTFLILAFTLVLGQELLTACGSAKVANFASNVGGLVTFIWSGDVLFELAIPCALCNIAGAYFGARMTVNKGTRVVRPMMLFVLVLLLAKVLRDLLGGG